MNKPVDSFVQNQNLGRGVNIIGYDPIWKSRQDGRMKAEHFRLLREAGFDHVRINLHPFRFMGPGPEHRIDPAWLETLDWAVQNSLENGLMAILDFHEFGALGEDPLGNRAKFLAAWRQLASRYQDTPDSVLFEILNEPNKALTPALWNEYYREPYALIRKTNPDRTLVIGPAHWNGIDHIDELELPEGDRNIIVTVHFYHPMPFTHQGAPWTEYRDRLGVVWSGTPEEQRAVSDFLGRAQTWAKAHNRPIYLGEFGAYDRAEMASRARYTAFVARQAEAFGWSWAYWQFDSDFILYDIPGNAWVEPLLGALIPSM
jgi:endoglucanase